MHLKHNKRIKSFATAHSDRHKAAAVYAKRYAYTVKIDEGIL